MTMATLIHHFTALTLLLAAKFETAFAQNCYYPNGHVSTTDAACITDGGACCPLNWECLSNGLCYYSPERYYGRYTCTDRDWGTSCANYCTANNTAPGNEAILQCDDGSYCCDGDRSFDCCTTEGSEVIHVPRGLIINSITKIETPTPVPSSASRTSQASSSTTSTSDETATTLSSSRTTDATAAANTATSSSTNSSSLTATASSQPAPKTNTLTIALGIGIPLSLILAAILALLIYRHLHNHPKYFKTRSKTPPENSPTTDYSSTLPYMYEKPSNLTEIDSYPIAQANPAFPTNNPNRISELSGSNHFLPTTPTTPTMTTMMMTMSPNSTSHTASSSPIPIPIPIPISPPLPPLNAEPAQELPPEGTRAKIPSTLRVINPDPIPPPYPIEKSPMNAMGQAYSCSQGVEWEEIRGGGGGGGRRRRREGEGTEAKPREKEKSPKQIDTEEREKLMANQDMSFEAEEEEERRGNINEKENENRNDNDNDNTNEKINTNTIIYRPYSQQMGNLFLPIVEEQQEEEEQEQEEKKRKKQ